VGTILRLSEFVLADPSTLADCFRAGQELSVTSLETADELIRRLCRVCLGARIAIKPPLRLLTVSGGPRSHCVKASDCRVIYLSFSRAAAGGKTPVSKYRQGKYLSGGARKPTRILFALGREMTSIRTTGRVALTSKNHLSYRFRMRILRLAGRFERESGGQRKASYQGSIIGKKSAG